MKIRTKEDHQVVGEVVTNHSMDIYAACDLAGVDTEEHYPEGLYMDYGDKEQIATIELDNDLGRGKVYAERDDEGLWKVLVELPSGEIEDPELPRREEIEMTWEDVGAAWGASTWAIEWVD